MYLRILFFFILHVLLEKTRKAMLRAWLQRFPPLPLNRGHSGPVQRVLEKRVLE